MAYTVPFHQIFNMFNHVYRFFVKIYINSTNLSLISKALYLDRYIVRFVYVTCSFIFLFATLSIMLHLLVHFRHQPAPNQNLKWKFYDFKHIRKISMFFNGTYVPICIKPLLKCDLMMLTICEPITAAVTDFTGAIISVNCSRRVTPILLSRPQVFIIPQVQVTPSTYSATLVDLIFPGYYKLPFGPSSWNLLLVCV